MKNRTQNNTVELKKIDAWNATAYNERLGVMAEGNKQQAEGNKQQAEGRKQQATSNRQKGKG